MFLCKKAMHLRHPLCAINLSYNSAVLHDRRSPLFFLILQAHDRIGYTYIMIPMRYVQ